MCLGNLGSAPQTARRDSKSGHRPGLDADRTGAPKNWSSPKKSIEREGLELAEVVVCPASLREFATEVLVKVGMPAEDAALVADTLVTADVRGVSSHGIVRLPFYVNKM